MVRCRNLFLRKHRRWPHFAYKTKWNQTFTQKQAMLSFKQLVAVAQDNLPPPILLSTLVRSFSLYNVHPTPQAYHFLIKTLIQNLHFNHIPSVLHHLEHVEKFQTPEYIFADLITTYGIANRIQDAVDIFYRIPKFRCVPSAYSLNSLLALLCRNQYSLKLVPQVLLKSLLMNIRVEESTLRILVSALCRMNKVSYAIDILQRMIDEGLGVNDKVCSFILSSICAKADLDGEDVMGLWRELGKLGFCPAMSDYNCLIRFLVKKGRGLDALDFLNQMKSVGIKPGIVSYTMALNGVIAEGDYMLADELFDELLMLGLVPDVYTYNAYIDALCKQNKVEEGIKMVACMEELRCKPNVLTYNMLLEAICKVGEISRAMELVKEMKYKGIKMNLVSYTVIIDGLVSKGEILEAHGLVEEVLHKCFCHQSLAFDEVICGLCQRGLVCEALELLRKMVAKNVSPGARGWEALLLSSESKINFANTTLIESVNSL
ncbi:PREDICTED: pentatricopeptide repeat-containing protein At2g38420, mitochondrial [Theobroma cacao]|uniref:Pentatricopeptide repeat-containing protein At2g38420, mitochondrial n=1 Tax=Theobroma cacao TaxID=3641 RepID=A0AB32WHD2_THECC|nr:PREDICTED: pentatricopeptide repeat-containing protein At2g38420, mitochondrial [Theobroma cacao]